MSAPYFLSTEERLARAFIPPKHVTLRALDVLALVSEPQGHRLVVDEWKEICLSILRGEKFREEHLAVIPNLERILGVSLEDVVRDALHSKINLTVASIARLAHLHMNHELISEQTVLGISTIVVNRFGPNGLMIFHLEYNKPA